MFFKFSHLYFVLDLQIPSDNLENHSKNRYSKSQSRCPMMATVTYQNENSAVFSSVNWFLLGLHILLKINPLHDSLYRKTTFNLLHVRLTFNVSTLTSLINGHARLFFSRNKFYPKVLSIFLCSKNWQKKSAGNHLPKDFS